MPTTEEPVFLGNVIINNIYVTGAATGSVSGGVSEYIKSETVTLNNDDGTKKLILGSPLYGGAQILVVKVGGGCSASFACTKTDDTVAGAVNRWSYSSNLVDLEIYIDWPANSKIRLYHKTFGSLSTTTEYKVTAMFCTA